VNRAVHQTLPAIDRPMFLFTPQKIKIAFITARNGYAHNRPAFNSKYRLRNEWKIVLLYGLVLLDKSMTFRARAAVRRVSLTGDDKLSETALLRAASTSLMARGRAVADVVIYVFCGSMGVKRTVYAACRANVTASLCVKAFSFQRPPYAGILTTS